MISNDNEIFFVEQKKTQINAENKHMPIAGLEPGPLA